MSIGTADFTKAVFSAWLESNLPATFKALWTADKQNQFATLHDESAPGEQPFPYCVVEIQQPRTIGRMSARGNRKLETREVNFSFNIHANKGTDGRSAKAIAAEMAEEIMKVFGGHPTESPVELRLDNGTVVLLRYQEDYSLRTDLYHHQWTIDYRALLDVPVTI